MNHDRLAKPAPGKTLKEPDRKGGAVDLGEVRRLFAEATHEWYALAESLSDLQQALEPADFESALEGLKLPSLEIMKREWEKAQAAYHGVVERESPRENGAEQSRERTDQPPGRPGPQESAPAAGHAPRTEESAPPDRARGPGQADADKSGPTPGETGPDAQLAESANQVTEEAETAERRAAPDKTTEIQEQLAELTDLLRQHISTSFGDGKDSPPKVEIPKQLTLTIAREVASRVKDSVLETLKTSGEGETRASGASGKEALTDADRQSRPEPKRIPFEDIAAMIDQLTNLH